MMLVDPAGGWKYGFPKEYPNDGVLSLEEWLVANGYPEKEFDKDGKCYWVRFWDEEEPAKKTVQVQGTEVERREKR